MKEIVFIVEQEEDGGFVAEAKVNENENEQIVTEGNDLDELKLMIREALECHFDNSEEMPKQVTVIM
ncbi:2-oxoisovalerate dehydrogenase [Dyadobacter sp. CY345]|uniref:type II toxin-antitoxin system HicB family antitoxin n=1 Tax=Dyadobacter sp. CY345 TaxID=2909335 RepID=UPI001F3D65F4|nr:2-oxoisovalerate dehydrogenase [Dyadobacter sp. CY345]MCF2444294.1 2-oxoisovalerate dehydrogenase [Dyadobacter sp. CY345]